MPSWLYCWWFEWLSAVRTVETPFSDVLRLGVLLGMPGLFFCLGLLLGIPGLFSWGALLRRPICFSLLVGGSDGIVLFDLEGSALLCSFGFCSGDWVSQ